MNKNDFYNKKLEEIYCCHKNIRRKVNTDCLIMGCTIPVACFNLDSLLILFSLCCISGKTFSNLIKEIKFMLDYDNYYKNSKEYLEAYSSYKIIIEEVSNLCKSLNWDNEMKIFAGYSYLLKKGYLSLNHNFYYYDNSNWCKHLFGNNIIMGVGNCKNISTMLRDLLRDNGYLSYNMSLFLDKEIIKLNQMEFLDLPEEFKKGNLEISYNNEFNELEEFLFGMVDKIIGPANHLVTLFTDDTHSYVMDATNDTLFLVNNWLKVYQENRKFDSYYEGINNENEKIKKKDIIKPTYIKRMFGRINDYGDVWNSCFELEDIFEQFYREHEDLYKDSVGKSKVLMKEYNKYNLFK